MGSRCFALLAGFLQFSESPDTEKSAGFSEAGSGALSLRPYQNRLGPRPGQPEDWCPVTLERPAPAVGVSGPPPQGPQYEVSDRLPGVRPQRFKSSPWPHPCSEISSPPGGTLLETFPCLAALSCFPCFSSRLLVRVFLTCLHSGIRPSGVTGANYKIVRQRPLSSVPIGCLEPPYSPHTAVQPECLIFFVSFSTSCGSGFYFRASLSSLPYTEPSGV